MYTGEQKGAGGAKHNKGSVKMSITTTKSETANQKIE